MTMPRLYTRERLAAELGKDRRFISKLLANVAADGRCGRYLGWRLSTVLPLLEGHSPYLRIKRPQGWGSP